MAATVLKLAGISESDVARCRELLRSGGVIAYPTDTFYGLGADPANGAAVRRLFDIKGRDADRPVLLLLPDRDAVASWSSSVTPAARGLMDRFWPGPLTLVLPAAAGVLPALTAGTGTIGLRVPGNEQTRSLLRRLGMALTGTSANRSGETGARSAEEVLARLGGSVDLVLDGGPAHSDLPSTVVDVTGETPRIVRQGIVDISGDTPSKEGL